MTKVAGPTSSASEREYRARVRGTVAAFAPTLDRRQRGILEMRALRDKPARLADVGKRFSVSGERVRQNSRPGPARAAQLHRGTRRRETDHNRRTKP